MLKGGSFFVDEPNDEFLKFSATWEGRELGDLKPGNEYKGCIKFIDKEAAKRAYASVKEASGVERDVKMIEYLDAREIEKVAEEEARRAEEKEISNMVDDLFAKYHDK